MTTLPERLLEMCRTPDGHDLPDHAEPLGADVATLREAAAALQAAPEGGVVIATLRNFRDTDGGLTTRLRPTGEAFGLPLGEHNLCLAAPSPAAALQAGDA